MKMTPPLRFALFLVGCMLAMTIFLGVLFFKNPIGINQWVARASLERMDLEKEVFVSDLEEHVYYRGGTERRTLVLLHGLGQQASSWVNVVPGILTRYRLIVPDLPGHGESGPKDGPLRLSDLRDGLVAILDRASADAPVTVLGHDVGGRVALLYALEHPDRVERVVLVNGGGSVDAPRDGLTRVPSTREEATRLVQALSPEGATIPAGFVLDDLMEKIAAGPAPRWLADDATSSLDERLGEIATGVDILWGVDDQLLPPELGQRLHRDLPRSRFHELPDCGHLPHQQCPGPFLAKLFAALEQSPPEAAEEIKVPENAAEQEPAEL